MEKTQSITPTSYLEILVHEAIAQHDYPAGQELMDEVVHEIEQQMQLLLKSMQDEEHLEEYVKVRQHQLVRLIDLICPYSTKQDVYMNIYKSLGELLNYLERNFARHLDENCKVPFPYLLMTQEYIMRYAQDIDQTAKGHGINPYLNDLASGCLRDLLEVEDNDFLYSYQEIVYLMKLCRELCRDFETDEELIGMLMYYNYNDPEFFTYLTERISAQMEQLPSVNTKKDLILQLQKNTHQIPANPGMYLNKLRKPIKRQLLFWLSKELALLESFEPRNYQSGELDGWKDFKVLTNFTVIQLGRFFGLLMEKGIIRSENKQELALFISVFFSTEQRDYIAPESIRRSFYNKDHHLSQSLRDIFIELINLSRKS